VNGVLLVDKPTGLSSHQVVARIRGQLHERRVGHAGTLDPDASGLLVLGIGAGTRLLRFLVGLDKTYAATIRLGISTVTDDASGDILRAPGCDPTTPIAAALAEFTGPLMQRPSSVSAIKVGGRRAHRRVRSGESVDLPERPVTVHDLQLLAATPRKVAAVAVLDLDVILTVSSGTYVRAIARDLGTVLGTGGHLVALRRTAVGPFSVADATAVDHVDSTSAVLPLGMVAEQVLPSEVLADDECAAVRHGTRIPCGSDVRGPVALLSKSGDLLAVSDCSDGRWRHRYVVSSATLDGP